MSNDRFNSPGSEQQLPPGIEVFTADLSEIEKLISGIDQNTDDESPSMIDVDLNYISPLITTIQDSATKSLDGLQPSSAWVNVYAEGDHFPDHQDWSEPCNRRTVISNVLGSADFTLTETDCILPLTEGDVVILDGRINPSHEILATAYRKAVVVIFE